MIDIQHSVVLPYGDRQLFDLVNDIEAYPLFLEGCERVRLLERHADHLDAEVEVALGGRRWQLVARNRFQAPQWIELELLDGPLHDFRGCWKFTPQAQGQCRVELQLRFRLPRRWLEPAARPVVHYMIRRSEASFRARAEALYGS